MEIYNLNKDVLNNPNDLRVGMKLRIPPENSSRSGSAQAALTQKISTSRNLQSKPWNSEDRSETTDSPRPEQISSLRFVPVHRNPFQPGKRRPYGRSYRWASSSHSNRDLSQKPPQELRNGDVFARDNLKRYTIRRGDSLEKIAVKFYGRRSAVQRLIEANRDVISNPHTIHPGVEIVLP